MVSNFVTVDMWVSDQLFLEESPDGGPTNQVPAFMYDVKFVAVLSCLFGCANLIILLYVPNTYV